MRFLVSDTSVLIDLERCELLRTAFALDDTELVVPDVLFERELRDHGGLELFELGLRVQTLSAEAVQQAQAYLRREPRLTVPDSFALSLARRNGWILLSGDSALRALAQAEDVPCHGVLWLVDRMEQENVATILQLRDGLQRLASHPRCRLPNGEVALRLERYALLIAR